jgi:hypothetical protein
MITVLSLIGWRWHKQTAMKVTVSGGGDDSGGYERKRGKIEIAEKGKVNSGEIQFIFY